MDLKELEILPKNYSRAPNLEAEPALGREYFRGAQP